MDICSTIEIAWLKFSNNWVENRVITWDLADLFSLLTSVLSVVIGLRVLFLNFLTSSSITSSSVLYSLRLRKYIYLYIQAPFG